MSGRGTPSVRVKLTKKDLFRYSDLLWQRRLGKFGKGVLIEWAPQVVFLIGLAALLPARDRFLEAGLVPEAVFGIAAFLYLLATTVRLYRPFVIPARHSFARLPTDYTLLPDGLDWRNELARGVLDWNAVTGVDEVRGFFLFPLDNLIVHIIPKRSFESSEAAQRFLDAARNYWEAARQWA